MNINCDQIYHFELRTSKKKLLGNTVEGIDKYYVIPVIHFESGSMFTMFFVCDEDGNVAPEDNEPFRTYLSKEQLAKIPEGKWFADYEDGKTIIEARILSGN